MIQKEKITANVIALTILVTVMFLTLRYLNMIDWEWYWLLSPLWMPYIFLFLVLALSLINIYLLSLLKKVLIHQRKVLENLKEEQKCQHKD